MGKYYTPEEKDFCIGFEFEYAEAYRDKKPIIQKEDIKVKLNPKVSGFIKNGNLLK